MEVKHNNYPERDYFWEVHILRQEHILRQSLGSAVSYSLVQRFLNFLDNGTLLECKTFDRTLKKTKTFLGFITR